MDDIASLQVDRRGYVVDEERDKVFKRLLSKPENAVCIDCNARNPTWISLTFAIHLCLNCSGRHRQFGSHISFVRSIDMDKFTREQLERISCGGNGRAKSYFKKYGLTRQPVDYASAVAQKYPALLDAELQNPQAVQQHEKSDAADLLDFGDAVKAEKQNAYVHSANSYSFGDGKHQGFSMTAGQMSLGQGSSSVSRSITLNSRSQSSPRSGFSGKVDVDFDAFEKSIRSEASSKKSSISNRSSVKDYESLTHTPAMSLTSMNESQSFSPLCMSTSQSPRPVAPPDMSQFAGKSGISSDEVFGRGVYSQTAPLNVSLNPNKTSISSDEYFGRQNRSRSRNSSATFEERAVQNIKEGISTAIKEGNKLMGMAKQWLNQQF